LKRKLHAQKRLKDDSGKERELGLGKSRRLLIFVPREVDYIDEQATFQLEVAGF